jgi:tetratricopeptide (TPR) repeat protein
MERHGKMDAARSASRRSLIFFFLVLLLTNPAIAVPQSSKADLQHVQTLVEAEQWQEIIKLLAPVSRQTADFDFYYGTALAQLGRLEEARSAFVAGKRLWPKDTRFFVELAGIAFKQKHYSEASHELHRALKLEPADSYTNDFLGTVYFLQGNLEAALKYWNLVGKPQVVAVESDPTPKIDPVLLDRAFAFSPASTLLLPDLLTTERRVRALEVFPTFHFDLEARPDGKFDVAFRNWEKNGWGNNKWIALLLLLRGLPAQSVYPEIFNIRHEAFNLHTLFRWDEEKRRVQAEFSDPIRRNPKEHFRLGADLRNENWNIRPSFTGPAPLLAGFNLRREAIDASFESLVSGRWHWSAAAELSQRDFRSVFTGPALTPELFAQGYQLKQMTQGEVMLWRNPDRRIALTGTASSQIGRIWSAPGHVFEKLQTSSQFNWFPSQGSDDYQFQESIRAGKTFGRVPFDELWMLGVGGDNDLWMRGHIATRDGRKGSAPLGRNYFLSNWEVNKKVYEFEVLKIKAGPFIDTGAIRDTSPGLGSHKWLWDVGAQVKASMFGFGVALSYGKDLRSGNNAVYVTLLP